MVTFVRKYQLPLLSFTLTAFVLAIVQSKVSRPMLMAERFIEGAGWAEILLIGFYAAFLTFKMQEPRMAAHWRRVSWTIFSVVFFTQLFLGLAGFERFLMTGKLHLPIPAMILSGTIFRAEIGFMPVLFLSTLILTGPAWCSQLCYFGALDSLSATAGKTGLKPVSHKFRIKHLLLLTIIIVTILLRIFRVDTLNTTLIAVGFGLAGIGIILFLSRKKGKMIHCILWCPIGTLVNYLKFISPFRMSIDQNCTDCMACMKYCQYDALNREDIARRKPGLTCTLCGDCLPACKILSIRYHFGNLNRDRSRNLWLVMTISLHAIFLALARI